MARILITDLSVETKYGIQVRSQLDGKVSDWSNYFEVITVKDTIAPADPTDLTFDVVNNSFVATWVAPTLNMDGSDLNGDLKDYVVTIIATNPLNPTQTMTRVYYTEKTSFELTPDDNKATFFDYQSNLTIRVQSRDFKNNVSTPGVTKTIVKAKPNPVTALTAGVKGTSFVASWTPPTLNTDGTDFDDFKNYNVVVTDGAYSQTVTTTDPNFTLTFDQVKTMFGQMKFSLTFKVSVVNQVGGESTQVNASATKPPPPPITNLSFVAADQGEFKATWTAPTGVDDLVGYNVAATANGVTVVFKVTDTKWTLSSSENATYFSTGLPNVPGARMPIANVSISVTSIDSLGQQSTAVTASAGNPAPGAPTGVTSSSGTDSMTVSWTAPADTDIIRYEVYTSPTSGGALTYVGQVSDKTTQLTFTSVQYAPAFYVAVKAFDEFNSASPATYSGSAKAPNSPFTVDTTPPAGTTISGVPATRPTTMSSAITASWTYSSPPADLAGFNVRYAETTNTTPTTREWQYVDVTDPAVRTLTVQNLRPSSPYVFQIRPYDTMFNAPGWSAESANITSSASEVQYTDIKSNISILTGGSLRSSDYTSAADNNGQGYGWLLSSAGLDIQRGTVNAATIKTGALTSTANVTYDSITQPAWSINTQGGAVLSDALVRGKLIVGVGGTQTNLSTAGQTGTPTANQGIFSGNYGGTGNQWAIKGDGTLEFRYGNSTSSRIQISSNGLEAWSGSTQTVRVGADGSAAFAGNLSGSSISNNGGTFAVDTAGNMTAKSGSIGGWTISTSLLSSGGLRLDPVNGMIDAGSAGSRIGMKAGVGFWAGSDNLNSASPFFVSTGGALSTSNATITGFLQSSNGNFYVDSSGNGRLNGNFDVKGHMEVGAQAYGVDSYVIVRRPSNGAWVMLDGRASTDTAIASSSGYFSVNYDGVLTATQANITGAITATSGSFTGNVYANGGYFKGDITGASGTFSGALGSYMSMYAPTITGGTIQTGSSGTWVRMIESQADALQFVSGGTVTAEIRGTMGATGGRGIYLNVDTQIGNTQSIIYQVGRRKGQGGAPSSTRVRGGSFSVTATSGAASISWDGMDVVPNCVNITLSNTGSSAYIWWVTNVSSSGCTLNVRYALDGAVPGTGNVQGYYYAESFV